MAPGHLEVVEIVGRGDLQGAGAEIQGDVGIGDDRDGAPQDRQAQGGAVVFFVALVLGINGHRGVAQEGLGAGGGHGDAAVALGQGVLDVVEVAVGGFVLHLEVGQGRLHSQAQPPPLPLRRPPLRAPDRALQLCQLRPARRTRLGPRQAFQNRRPPPRRTLLLRPYRRHRHRRRPARRNAPNRIRHLLALLHHAPRPHQPVARRYDPPFRAPIPGPGPLLPERPRHRTRFPPPLARPGQLLLRRIVEPNPRPQHQRPRTRRHR